MNILQTPRAAIILAIVYFAFPLDLIPDIFGPIGRLDDLVVFGFALWRVLKGSPRTTTADNASPQTEQRKDPRSPHEIFGLQKNATKEEIEARYKELAKQYHPDRVEQLGPELKKLAHEKMIEIQRAYEELEKLPR